MKLSRLLFLGVRDLPASAEWPVTAAGWLVMRFSRGPAYCFAGQRIFEINSGDVLVAPPGRPVIIRASQIDNVQLHYFSFQPELLGCVLTLPERRQLSVLAGSPAREIRHLPASHVIAVQYAGLCDESAGENWLLQRCRILTLAALLFAPDLRPLARATSPLAVARARFLDLVQRIPEEELVGRSLAELAAHCRCSLPHFKRLFRDHFGASVRAKKIELRLDKARQLVCETDAKIGDVARDSDYLCLSLFNKMFKKHFGMTPTQIRKSRGTSGSLEACTR
jgi:AraC-like DNA-binding protein